MQTDNLFNLLKLSLIGLMVFSPVAIAQPLPAKKSALMFQDITLSPQLSPDPMVGQGISGGSEETTKIAGRAKTETGDCIGFGYFLLKLQGGKEE